MKGGIYINKGKGARFIVKFGNIFRRFEDEEDADRFLTGLRWETDRGSFDPRDHQITKPLAFRNLGEEYLKLRRPELKAWDALNNRLGKAITYFGDCSIKEIDYPELRKFFTSLPVSLATKDAIKRTLRAFWSWVQDEHNIPIPKFPKFKYEYTRKRTIGKPLQSRIVERVELTGPPRVGLAVRLLSIYFSLRPAELLGANEGDFDFENKTIWVDGKTGGKEIPMLEEDLEAIKALRDGNPDAPLFRHERGYLEGRRLSVAVLRRAWYKACENLQVTGVDLYRGTRHSTARALKGEYSLEEIKKGTMHETSACFDRYVNFGGDDVRAMYEAARGKKTSLGDTRVIPIDRQKRRRKIP